jgi:hypothetical protein
MIDTLVVRDLGNSTTSPMHLLTWPDGAIGEEIGSG